ncbi:hypothetical protein K7X08_031496 [Anisodus acutangulus]|uniref:Uncharacterized protein n=1 Tax=Anisodus acutangulus TaxID=402998 RepID=A0A9Q1RM67_9SOLA|nr:hypothetical protein K7X08_031496 [Anisodus acutangulus]
MTGKKEMKNVFDQHVEEKSFNGHDSREVKGISKKRPVARLSPSCGAADTNIHPKSGSSWPSVSSSVRKRRAPDSSEPIMEGISYQVLHCHRMEKIRKEVIPEVVVLDDDIDEDTEGIGEGGEIPADEAIPIEPKSVVESPDVLGKWIPIGDLEAPEGSTGARETTKPVNMNAITPSRGEAARVLDSEASPSHPTPRGVMVDIPTGVDLLSDLPTAAQILGSFLGPEGRIKLEVSDLENSLSQLVASILQSHLLATATLKKEKGQMVELTTLSGDVERLRAEAGEIRSINARLQADNEMLLAIRASLAQRLEESQREQEELEVEVSSLTQVNRNLQVEVYLKEGEQAHLFSVNEVLRDKVSQLEDDKARLETRSNEFQARRKADKYVAALDRNWVTLKNQVDTLHAIRSGDLDLPQAIAKAEEAADASKQVLEQALFENDEEHSECEGSVGLSSDEDAL